MKTFFYISVPILFLVIFININACKKNLDLVQEGLPTNKNFNTSERDIDALMAYLYFASGEDGAKSSNSDFMYGRGYMWLISCSDDMSVGQASNAMANLRNFVTGIMPTNERMVPFWPIRYGIIKKGNELIKLVQNSSLSEELKRKYLGFAYFQTAVMYYELTYPYADSRAGVPIVNADSPNVQQPRVANAEVNWALVEDYLKKAAAYLPYFAELTGSQLGFGHKTAAWAYLSKMYLYRKNYAMSELYADSVITSGRHALMSKYEDVFKIVNNWGSEYIWSRPGDPISPDGSGNGSQLPGCIFIKGGTGLRYNGFGLFQPTKELYNEYEAGDTRLAATIIKPGDSVILEGKKIPVVATGTPTASNLPPTIFVLPQPTADQPYGITITGYMFKKYIDPYTHSNPIGSTVSPNLNRACSKLSIPLLRYAEVLLISAEAKIMQGKSGDIEINLIRQRAGLAPKGGATMIDLKHERRCELAAEFSDRHFDLVRWGDAQAAYAKPLTSFNNKKVFVGAAFNPAIHNVWPLSKTDIDASGNILKQNAGY